MAIVSISIECQCYGSSNVISFNRYLDMMQAQTAPLPEDSPAPSNDSLVRSFNIPADGGWGKKINSELLDKMSDEQLGQLYELRAEVKKTLGDK